MPVITVTECLKIMDTGTPFSCLVVTYDRTRKKGGKLLEIPQARIDRKTDFVIPEGNLGEAAPRPMTDYEAKLAALRTPHEGGRGANPNHSHWYTRNLTILADGHPLTDLVKIHPPLMIEFNGIPVVP